ncbi:hypothetical protein [Chamaesiphon sp.]|uniref:hypothetical protein n=1 Tax=Chamaesiphon sp. TaxID=2814140 RepID=UPI003593903C
MVEEWNFISKSSVQIKRVEGEVDLRIGFSFVLTGLPIPTINRHYGFYAAPKSSSFATEKGSAQVASAITNRGISDK